MIVRSNIVVILLIMVGKSKACQTKVKPNRNFDHYRASSSMVGKPTKLSVDTTAIEFIIVEPPWSTLNEKRCELEVYCRWHGLQVPKARSAELPRDEPVNILARCEQENNHTDSSKPHNQPLFHKKTIWLLKQGLAT